MAVSRWTDAILLDLVIKVVLGSAPDELPPAFAADRGRLYFGPEHDLKTIQSELPHTLAQLRAQFGWIDQRLATSRPYILGDQPGLPDALAYYLVWFLCGRWTDGTAFISEFPAIEAWRDRMAAIGHGTPTNLSAEDALEIARTHKPEAVKRGDSIDYQALTPGMRVSIRPIEDGGDPMVVGRICHLDAETIAVSRQDEQLGAIVVYFPRVGYRVEAA